MRDGQVWASRVRLSAALVTTLLAVMPAATQAQTVTAMWDASPPSDEVTGYQVCIGTASLTCNIQMASVAPSSVSLAFSPTGGVLHNIAVRAVNQLGIGPYSTEVIFSIPSFSQPANQSGQVGVAITPLTLLIVDPDNSPLTITHTGLPIGLSIDSANRRITGTPSAAGTYNVTINVSDGLATVSRSFVWTIAAGAVISSVSVTPNSGSGATQTFALEYADSLGATDLSRVWMRFSATSSGTTGTCLLLYDRAAAALNLLNDAGSSWMTGMLGSPGTLRNTQCSVALGASSASLSGTRLIVNLSMTFSASYAGSKNVYMFAENGSVTSGGWQSRGAWTVPSTSVSVTSDSVTPSSGTGTAQTFALRYSDTLGAADLRQVWATFGASTGVTGTCMLMYDRAAATVNLLNDAGTAWISGMPGGATVLQNTQCAVALASSSAASSGNTLTLNVAMSFRSTYAGTKSIYMYAFGSATTSGGWQTRGTWTVPTGSVSVTSDSATPSSGSGSSQTFALRYSDTLGASDLRQVWTTFSTAPGTTGTCMVMYDRAAATLSLLNDAGTAWMAGTPGSATVLQNNQCAVALASSSAASSGNTLTLNLAMSFRSTYGGTKNIYMYAAGSTTSSGGWQTRGTWTVPSGSVSVTADSATPNSGSGTSQTFALRYSDTLGAADLREVWATFSTVPTVTGTCLLRYDRAAATLSLLNDAGTAWMSGTLGTAGVLLQNTQCAVALAGSSASSSGNTLTLNLAMLFRSTYSGTKTIYMYGAGSTTTTGGWQARGTWTVAAQ